MVEQTGWMSSLFGDAITLLGTLSKVRFMSVSFPEHEPTQDERDDDTRKQPLIPCFEVVFYSVE